MTTEIPSINIPPCVINEVGYRLEQYETEPYIRSVLIQMLSDQPHLLRHLRDNRAPYMREPLAYAFGNAVAYDLIARYLRQSGIAIQIQPADTALHLQDLEESIESKSEHSTTYNLLWIVSLLEKDAPETVPFIGSISSELSTKDAKDGFIQGVCDIFAIYLTLIENKRIHNEVAQ